MGYTTKFSGHVSLSRPLTLAEAKQMLTWASDPDQIEGDCPGSFLQWVPSTTLDSIGWDGGEKFYDYIDWLKWVCAWLTSIEISANGTILWAGEEASDVGKITVENNTVSLDSATIRQTNFEPLTLERLGELALEKVITEGN